jgi:NADH:ubiquinone oxidoreductase subunit 6 (subunit J)
MEIANIIFYTFIGITLISALFIMLTKNILYSAFALIATFLGMAGIFVLLGAEFVAITQILIYVGGILILIVFGIMLTNRGQTSRVDTKIYNKFSGILIAAGFFYLLARGIGAADFGGMAWMTNSNSSPSSISHLGMKVMTDYVLVFEVIGILLLVALIGAVHIAGHTREEVENVD